MNYKEKIEEIGKRKRVLIEVDTSKLPGVLVTERRNLVRNVINSLIDLIRTHVKVSLTQDDDGVYVIVDIAGVVIFSRQVKI